MKGASRLGVFGGTFDPIHAGHLIAAECVSDAFELDGVLFVPAGAPPHKEASSVSDARHRYMMTLLATLSNPKFEVNRVDLDRPGPHFTVDMLDLLQRQVGEEVELFFIMGADSLLDLPAWHEPERLLTTHRVIVTGRPGFDLALAKERLGSLLADNEPRVFFADIPMVEVASRDIRRRASEGESIRYLVPDLVLRYIYDNELY